MTAQPILGFPSKSAAREHFSKLLHSAELDADLPPADMVLVYRLLTLHPNADEKIGPGVSAMRVVSAQKGSRCFAAVHVTGHVELFSYTKCLAGEETPLAKFTAAAREEITEQAAAFLYAQARRGPLVCALTGEQLNGPGDAAVDHTPPRVFALFRSMYLEARPELAANLGDVLYRSLPNGGHVFADAALADDWRQWHARHANLRVLAKPEHERVSRYVVRPLSQTFRNGKAPNAGDIASDRRVTLRMSEVENERMLQEFRADSASTGQLAAGDAARMLTRFQRRLVNEEEMTREGSTFYSSTEWLT